MYSLSSYISKKVNEITTSADIAYLPSGFISIKDILKRLAQNKKRWKIEILESPEEYSVRFEDALTVHVKKRDWEKFNEEVEGRIVKSDDCIEIDLSESLLEAYQDKIEELKKSLRGQVFGMLIKEPVVSLDRDLSAWIRNFGVKEYVKSGDTLIEYSSLEESVNNLVKKLEDAYKDDRGSLELLIEAFKKKRPLNTFDVFKDYDYLIGASVISKYGGVELRFDGFVNMAWILSESIYVGDEEIADAMGEYPGIKVSGKVLYPQGKTFPDKIMKFLKDEIKLGGKND